MLDRVVKKKLFIKSIADFVKCRYIASWIPFSLDDELNVEVKKSIEKKWSRVYGPVEKELRNASQLKHGGKNTYVLSMFPYPSGSLHLGHVRVYTLSDVLSRFYRLRGNNVVNPMGWDAFGLPAENAARDQKVDPEKWTRENIDLMRKQLDEMGCSFDWDREFATCDPSYFKWTQWLFKKLYEKGLAYKKRSFVYWDPVDQTVLAEEQVDSEGNSWRSGAKVEKKLLSQWFIKTTIFAKDLHEGLSGDLKSGWRDIIDLQKHWIGEINGLFADTRVLVATPKEVFEETLRLWFTSKDALTKATCFILHPDHYLVNVEGQVLREYPNGLKEMKFRIENPATGQRLPVFVASKELCPSVPDSVDVRTDEHLDPEKYEKLASKEAFLEEIRKEALKKEVLGEVSEKEFEFNPASLKLRDWLVSRQRGWGTPIPILTCSVCDEQREAEDLPILQNTKEIIEYCKKCGEETTHKTETDTLDTFFDSSWYYLRFLDPNNEEAIFDPEKVKTFLPVNVYIGGKEHATLHLFYARFMSHFLHQLNLIPIKETFKRLIPVGVVQGETFVNSSGKYLKKDEVSKENEKWIEKETGEVIELQWEKMSKSKFNGLDPANVMEQYGVDTMRFLSMVEVIPTSYRKWPSPNFLSFLKYERKLWDTVREFVNAKEIGSIELVDEDFLNNEELRLFDERNFYLKGIRHSYEDFNQISIAISKIQALTAALKKTPKLLIPESLEYEKILGTILISLYPIIPALTSECWQAFRGAATLTETDFLLNEEIWKQKWPEVDGHYKLDLCLQVCGEEMGIVKVPRSILDDLSLDVAVEYALETEEMEKYISRDSLEVISYSVEPSYRAQLNVRDKVKPFNLSAYKKAKKAEKKKAAAERKQAEEDKQQTQTPLDNMRDEKKTQVNK